MWMIFLRDFSAAGTLQPEWHEHPSAAEAALYSSVSARIKIALES